MRGIHLAIDSNHLNSNNAQVAVSGWNKLDVSLSSCNMYIRNAVDHDEETETLPKLEDVAVARRVIGFMIHAAIKHKKESFSLKAYNEFLKQAGNLKALEFISIAEVEKERAKKEAETPKIEFDIGPKTVIEKVVEEMTSKVPNVEHTIISAPVEKEVAEVEIESTPDEPKKSGRGRKVDPNSPANRCHEVFKAQPLAKQKREEIIPIFMKEFSLPYNTAQTYFYNTCKKLGLKPKEAGTKSV